MCLYLAGPMSGLPDLNFAAFFATAERLRSWGHWVVNPAEESFLVAAGRELDTVPRVDYLRHDIRLLLVCQAVAVLPGWEQSKGARLEVAIARALDMPVLDAETLKPIEEEEQPCPCTGNEP